MVASVIAVVNGKGGTTKTTMVENLAPIWGALGRRVLVIDLDPRFSLTRHLFDFGQDLGPPRSAYELLAGDTDVAGASAPTQLERVWLIASPGELLERGEQEMANADYREEILADALEGELGSFDVVLLDCPANLGLLTMNALHAADEVLVPVSMQDEGAFNGVAGVADKVAAVAKRRKGSPRIAALVRTRVREDAASFRELDEAVRAFGLPIAAAMIPESRWFHSAGVRRIPLAAWRPQAPGSVAYRKLASELAPLAASAALRKVA